MPPSITAPINQCPINRSPSDRITSLTAGGANSWSDEMDFAFAYLDVKPSPPDAADVDAEEAVDPAANGLR